MKKAYITPEMKAKNLSAGNFLALSIWQDEDADPAGGALSKWGDLWDDDLDDDEKEKRHIYRY